MRAMKYVVIEYQNNYLDESIDTFDTKAEAKAFFDELWKNRYKRYSMDYLLGGYEVHLYQAECKFVEDGRYWTPVYDLLLDDFMPIDVNTEIDLFVEDREEILSSIFEV